MVSNICSIAKRSDGLSRRVSGPDRMRAMSGLTDLDALLAALEPERRDGSFVFVTLAALDPTLPTQATVEEAEGLTCVVRQSIADQRGLPYDFVAAWITLRAHSALDAVGLTAAVSGALAEAGISCNLLAGHFHDHLLVPHDRADDAMQVLDALRAR